jgi:hypothetical protein
VRWGRPYGNLARKDPVFCAGVVALHEAVCVDHEHHCSPHHRLKRSTFAPRFCQPLSLAIRCTQLLSKLPNSLLQIGCEQRSVCRIPPRTACLLSAPNRHQTPSPPNRQARPLRRQRVPTATRPTFHANKLHTARFNAPGEPLDCREDGPPTRLQSSGSRTLTAHHALQH